MTRFTKMQAYGNDYVYIDAINQKINNLEISSIRTDLVNFINDLENNVSKSEIQKLNSHQMYTRYVDIVYPKPK